MPSCPSVDSATTGVVGRLGRSDAGSVRLEPVAGGVSELLRQRTTSHILQRSVLESFQSVGIQTYRKSGSAETTAEYRLKNH